MKDTIGLWIGAMFLWTPAALAQCGTCDPCTEVGGLIMTDTTWTCADSPYCVTQSVIVGGGATLTIEPCVELRFKHNIGLSVGYGFGPGTLVARGTAQQPICFTTNDPCENPPNPADPNDWARVLFENDAVDAAFDPNGHYVSGCVMEYVTVEYSGSGGAAITATNSSPYLAHCDVHDNGQNAVQIDALNAGAVRIEYCHVYDHANGKGIHVRSSASWPVRIDNCEVDHCGGAYTYGAGIYLDAGTGHRISNNFVHDCELSGSGDKLGGGMYINAPATVEANTVTNNHVNNTSGYNRAYGGGIMLDTGCDGSTLLNNVVTGNWADAHYYEANGGGICVWNSTGCTLTGNTVSNNWADGWGGGIRLHGSGGSTLRQNTVSGNNNGWSTDWKGGGIAVRDSTNCLFEDNAITGNSTTAQNADGGGLYLFNSSTGIGDNKGIRGNTITGNTTSGRYADGAGIYLEDSGSTILEGNVITDNTASGNDVAGGAIRVYNCAGSRFESNLISANAATGTNTDGGGVHFQNSANCVLDSNVVTDNSCVDEGAGLFFGNSTGTMLHCNAIIGNTAGDDGGALYVGNSNDCTIAMCRITNNQSTGSVTGGIFVYNSANLNLSGDPNVPCENNTIGGNGGYDIYNSNPTGTNINAAYVRWICECTPDPSPCIYDHFDDAAKGIVFWYPTKPGVLGDLNCDGVVDFDDINPFISALADYVGFYMEFPCWDHTSADCDENCIVDFDDINPFVEFLSGGR